MDNQGPETNFIATPLDPISDRIIGAAIEVHRTLGPGLLESAYEECLAFEISTAGLTVKRQVLLPVVYKTIRLDQAYRIDLLVEDRLIVEVKTGEQINKIHEAQLLTYLRLSGVRTGLLLNFHAALLKKGIKRMVL